MHRDDRQNVPSNARAGTLLRSLSLPTPLHAVAADPAEHALYLAGGDGRVFEASLVGGGDDGGRGGDGAGAVAVRCRGSAVSTPATIAEMGLALARR